MKYISYIFLAFSAALSCSGCAYFYNRGRDAGDIVTVSAGVGYGGAKAKVGPLQLALFQNQDVAGLRCGRLFFFSEDNRIKEIASPFAELYHGAYQVDGFTLDYPEKDPRNKDYAAYGPFLFMIFDQKKPQLYSQV